MNQKAVKRLTGRLNHKDGISQRSLAKSLKVSPSYINYVIKIRQIFAIEKNSGSKTIPHSGSSYSSKM